ncbi:hypothetical protein TWF718_004670 [Orbilia javanica]|uniref:Uncharacterized protein n=1 Tax=Orbilia javanica TaxID=47235 RepID=A0AAN8MXX8_9PEZI
MLLVLAQVAPLDDNLQVVEFIFALKRSAGMIDTSGLVPRPGTNGFKIEQVGALVDFKVDSESEEGTLGNVESYVDGVYKIKLLDSEEIVEVPEGNVTKLEPIRMMNTSGHIFRS